MRMGLSFSASPAGALATACTVTPRSFALFSSTGRAAAEAGTQIAPVPRSSPSALLGRLQPVDLGIGLHQAIDQHERIVDAVADQVAGRSRRPDHRHRGRRQQPVDLREGAVEAIEDAVVLARPSAWRASSR